MILGLILVPVLLTDEREEANKSTLEEKKAFFEFARLGPYCGIYFSHPRVDIQFAR